MRPAWNLFSLTALGLCALLGSCAAPGPLRIAPGTTQTTVESLGFSKAPADVWVAEVRDLSGAADGAREPLRRALYAGLVARLFSPVRLAYVDQRREVGRSEPTLEGPEDLLLRTAVLHFDATALESSGIVDAEVEAELVRFVDGAPVVLWRTFLSRRLQVEMADVRRTARADLIRLLAERLAAEVLVELPARGSVAPPAGEAPQPAAAPAPSAAASPAPSAGPAAGG